MLFDQFEETLTASAGAQLFVISQLTDTAHLYRKCVETHLQGEEKVQLSCRRCRFLIRGAVVSGMRKKNKVQFQ